MARFKFDEPLSVPLMLLIPTYETSYGVRKNVYPAMENGVLIFGSFKTYGGTERDSDGLYTVENTAVIRTWYRPDITSECRIGIPATGEVYDILGEPENISMRNQFLQFKVLQVKGGA